MHPFRTSLVAIGFAMQGCGPADTVSAGNAAPETAVPAEAAPSDSTRAAEPEEISASEAQNGSAGGSGVGSGGGGSGGSSGQPCGLGTLTGCGPLQAPTLAEQGEAVRLNVIHGPPAGPAAELNVTRPPLPPR